MVTTAGVVFDREGDDSERRVVLERDEARELGDAIDLAVAHDGRRAPAVENEVLEPVLAVGRGERANVHRGAYHRRSMTTVMVRVRAARAWCAPVGARS